MYTYRDDGGYQNIYNERTNKQVGILWPEYKRFDGRHQCVGYEVEVICARPTKRKRGADNTQYKTPFFRDPHDAAMYCMAHSVHGSQASPKRED